MQFDRRLTALAGCPVLKVDNGGGMLFGPHPVIHADSDEVLAHEVCHILAGKYDYDVFHTAVVARGDERPAFKTILNWLYDWYHEYNHNGYSGFLNNKLTDLHNRCDSTNKMIEQIPALKVIVDLYHARNINPAEHGVRDVVDLVAWADRADKDIPEELLPRLMSMLNNKDEQQGRTKSSNITGAGNDVGHLPPKSDYYFKAVAKYGHVIKELSSMWKKNRYDWDYHYFGEINWKNLCGMYLGDALHLPVYKLFGMISLSRSVYLVIDRSSSTSSIKETIMDTAIMVAESLRILNVPISVLDVGPQNRVVNRIDEDLDLSWFTPTAVNGTPLGEVCHKISGADCDSYLLIVTDGAPDSWESLTSALHKFPGCNLTFIIGSSFNVYRKHIKNCVSVEPHTIIREMLRDQSLS